MIKSRIKVINVGYGKGKAKLISTQIKTKYGETQKILVAQVPSKTENCTKEEHEEIIEDILEHLEKIIESSQRVTVVGDFNCNEVKWEIFESGDANTWSNISLRLMMNNTMGN